MVIKNFNNLFNSIKTVVEEAYLSLISLFKLNYKNVWSYTKINTIISFLYSLKIKFIH